MPIDTSIYGMVGRGVKSVADYDQEHMQTQQNKLAQTLGLMKLDEHKRGIEDQNALRAALSGGVDPYQALLKQGNVKGATDYQKAQAENDKTKAESKYKAVETVSKKIGMYRDGVANINDPQTAAQYVQAMHQDPDFKGTAISAVPLDQLLAKIPTDPAGLQRWKQEFALGATKFIELNKQQFVQSNLGGTNKITGIGGLDGVATTVAENAITQSPDNAASNAQSAANAKLTDERAREFNSTKVEENKLRREQKQETADLTKNSQIASFDTMLGTLGRLKQHPGLKRSVGTTGMFPTMPGSDSANFQAELNTFQSQAFIPMVSQLKGMGALSDAEGKKLTAAVGALDPKMGEQAFRESVDRIITEMEAAKARVSGGSVQPKNTGGAEGSWGQSAPLSVKNADDYAKIPRGARYITPDGKTREKR